MTLNKQIVLDSRPTDKVTPANFRLVEAPLAAPGPGEVLVRHHYLSLDPYMRGRLSDAKSYAKPQEVGATMGGGTVGEVVASNNPRFKPGDFVVGMGGWRLYALSDGRDLNVVDAATIPLQAYLGPVGMPGVTAWYGLNKIIAPKKGETVVVSAATGAVGSVVGQLAKIAGARTVGVAGGADKCAYATSDLGYDVCVDHKSPRFADFARIAICGLIASYEGPPTALPNMALFLVRRIKVEGFIVSDHLPLWPQAIGELAGHVAAGRLHWRETIRDGLQSAPQALVDLLHGGNFGKMLVKLV
ncbi:MAG: NADP-dependent oxidoreductase [Roseiarcus sp.]